MQVSIDKISKIQSKHGGEIIRIDGHHENEFGELVKGYCFIDPKNDNWGQWVQSMEHIALNRGKYTILDNVHMKSKAKGLWDADSKPIVVDTIQKPIKSTNNNFTELFDDENPNI